MPWAVQKDAPIELRMATGILLANLKRVDGGICAEVYLLCHQITLLCQGTMGPRAATHQGRRGGKP